MRLVSFDFGNCIILYTIRDDEKTNSFSVIPFSLNRRFKVLGTLARFSDVIFVYNYRAKQMGELIPDPTEAKTICRLINANLNEVL